MKSMSSVLDNFAVLEGLDGAGTTTQIELLEERFKEAGIPFHCTCEPTRGPIGSIIRDVLRGGSSVHPYTMALLYAADRSEHIEKPDHGIRSHLHRGEVVVTDRYIFSSLAYQGIDNGFEKVLSLNVGFPLPEILFFVDTPPEICQQRMERRHGRELFDSLEFQREVHAAYRRTMSWFADSPMRVHRIDGRQSSEDICRCIWTELRKLPIFKM